MVWSLSQDDDGLESVTPPQPGAERASTSVVIDPISQIPEAPRSDFSNPRPIEQTKVLGQRKVDALRAEVARHHRRYARQKQIRLLLWGLAGAASVALGAILAGVVLPTSAPEGAETSGTEPGSVGAQEQAAQARSSAVPSDDADEPAEVAAAQTPAPGIAPAEQVESAKPSAPTNQKGAVSLDDLGEDDDAPAADADSAAAKPSAVTLDDLPLE